MKKLYIYLLSTLYCICLNAQTSSFIKKYNYYESVSLNVINNKNYISYSPEFSRTGFIAQINDNGDTLMAKCYNTSTKYPPFLRDGYWQNSILVVASTHPYAQNVTGTLFTKTDTNLNYSIFKKYTCATNNAFAVAPNELNDSSFIFAGTTSQNPNSIYPSDIAVMKTDKNENPLWAKKYDTGFQDFINGSIIINNDKTILIYGGTSQTALTPDFVMLKLDSLGNQLWAKAIGGDRADGGEIFRINNYYYMIGGTTSYGVATNSSGICIYKLDTLGNLINAKYISGAIYPQPGIRTSYNNNGTFTLTGFSNSGPPSYNWDFIAMRIDTNGLVLNNKGYELSTGDNQGLGFVKSNDGGYIFICTGSGGPPNYLPDYPILFKTDSLFNSDCLPSQTYSLTTTDVTSQTHDTAIVFNVSTIAINVSADTIFRTAPVYAVNTECVRYIGVDELRMKIRELKIYPNPSNGNFTLQINQSKAAERACLVIYDVLGKEVYNMQNIVLTAGLNEINITIQQLPPGIYFCKLNAGSIFYGSKICVE